MKSKRVAEIYSLADRRRNHAELKRCTEQLALTEVYRVLLHNARHAVLVLESAKNESGATLWGRTKDEWIDFIAACENKLTSAISTSESTGMAIVGRPFSGVWNDHVSRSTSSNQGFDGPGFYVKGSAGWFSAYDGYFGGHDFVDEILFLSDVHGFSRHARFMDSPMNISSFEIEYRFLDGGIRIYGSNGFFTDAPRGAYLFGFKVLRWILAQLSLKQPRRLKGEGGGSPG